jgi:hypothetical protein
MIEPIRLALEVAPHYQDLANEPISAMEERA